MYLTSQSIIWEGPRPDVLIELTLFSQEELHSQKDEHRLEMKTFIGETWKEFSAAPDLRNENTQGCCWPKSSTIVAVTQTAGKLAGSFYVVLLECGLFTGQQTVGGGCWYPKGNMLSLKCEEILERLSAFTAPIRLHLPQHELQENYWHFSF